MKIQRKQASARSLPPSTMEVLNLKLSDQYRFDCASSSINKKLIKAISIEHLQFRLGEINASILEALPDNRSASSWSLLSFFDNCYNNQRSNSHIRRVLLDPSGIVCKRLSSISDKDGITWSLEAKSVYNESSTFDEIRQISREWVIFLKVSLA